VVISDDHCGKPFYKSSRENRLAAARLGNIVPRQPVLSPKAHFMPPRFGWVASLTMADRPSFQSASSTTAITTGFTP
jgi:hypothetical protein